MRSRNEHVLKMHWTFESGRDYGRGMICVRSIDALLRCIESKVMESVVRRFAPEEFLTLHPSAGRCRALPALSVYLLNPKKLPIAER
jgi:hypothetical protein